MADLEEIQVGKKYRFTLEVTGWLAGIAVPYDELRVYGSNKPIPIIGNVKYGELDIVDAAGQHHSIPAQVVLDVEETQ